MAYLKAYQWEKEKFPEAYDRGVLPQYRIPLTIKLAREFGINGIRVSLSTHTRALATRWGIDLPKPGYDCPLGYLYHEIAHHLAKDYEELSGEERGHGPKFKHCLIKVSIESRSLLPKLLAEIGKELEGQQVKAKVVAEKEIAKAEKKADAKEFRKTRAYRIVKVSERIKRLERKIKSLNSRLKSAKRSKTALERAEIKAQAAKQGAGAILPIKV